MASWARLVRRAAVCTVRARDGEGEWASETPVAAAWGAGAREWRLVVSER